MAKVNPILKSTMEEMGSELLTPMSPEEEYVLEQGQEELNEAGVVVEKSEEQLESVTHSETELHTINDIQNENIKIIEADSEGNIEPVEGGFQAPLPENEDDAVRVISEQIATEQIVVENIAGILGCRSTRNESGTSQLYKALGIKKTPFSAREVHTESFGSVNKKMKAISLYKSHAEGIGDVIAKLGSSAWEGIKKLIRAVIDYISLSIKNMFNSHVYKKGILDDKKFFETLTTTEFSIECGHSLNNLYYQLETPLELVNNLEVSLDFLTRSIDVLRDMSVPDNEIADRCGLKEYKSSLKPLRLYNVPQNSTAVKTSDPDMMSFPEGVIHLNGVVNNLEVRRLGEGMIPGSISYRYWVSTPFKPVRNNLDVISGARVKTYGIEICDAALDLIRLVNKVEYVRKSLMDLEKQLNLLNTEEVRARKFSVATIVKYTYDVTSSVARMGEVAMTLRNNAEKVLKGKQ